MFKIPKAMSSISSALICVSRPATSRRAVMCITVMFITDLICLHALLWLRNVYIIIYIIISGCIALKNAGPVLFRKRVHLTCTKYGAVPHKHLTVIYHVEYFDYF